MASISSNVLVWEIDNTPDPNKIPKLVKEDIIIDPTWQPDWLVEQAMKKIEELQTEGSETYNLLASALRAKEKIEDFFNTFQLDETTDKGALKLKPKDVTGAMLDLDRVVTSINTLKKKVEEDTFEAVKTRANKVISPFANPDSLNE